MVQIEIPDAGQSDVLGGLQRGVVVLPLAGFACHQESVGVWRLSEAHAVLLVEQNDDFLDELGDRFSLQNRLHADQPVLALSVDPHRGGRAPERDEGGGFGGLSNE